MKDDFDGLFEDAADPGDLSQLSVLRLPPTRDLDHNSQMVFIKWPAGTEIDPIVHKTGTSNADGEIVRWELSADSQVQTNAYMIQWSDDTWSLRINDALFDIQVHPANNTFVYAGQDVMEKVGTVQSRFIAKPYDGLRRESRSKVKMAVTAEDPELKKMEMGRVETIKSRLKHKMENRQSILEQRKLAQIYNKGITKEWLEDNSSGSESMGEQDPKKRLASLIFDSDSDT